MRGGRRHDPAQAFGALPQGARAAVRLLAACLSLVVHLAEPACLPVRHQSLRRPAAPLCCSLFFFLAQMFEKARSEPTTSVIGGSIGEIRCVPPPARPPSDPGSQEGAPVPVAFVLFSRRCVARRAKRVTAERNPLTGCPTPPPPPPLPQRKQTHRALKKEVEKEAAAPTYTAEDLGLTPLKKRDKLARGEKVVVCDGSSIGWEGEVLSVRRVSFMRGDGVVASCHLHPNTTFAGRYWRFFSEAFLDLRLAAPPESLSTMWVLESSERSVRIWAPSASPSALEDISPRRPRPGSHSPSDCTFSSSVVTPPHRPGNTQNSPAARLSTLTPTSRRATPLPLDAPTRRKSINPRPGKTSNRDVEVFLPSAEASMRFAFAQLSRVPPGGVKWPSQSPSGGRLPNKRLPGGVAGGGPPGGAEMVRG